jgi:hypothetical protein
MSNYQQTNTSRDKILCFFTFVIVNPSIQNVYGVYVHVQKYDPRIKIHRLKIISLC